MNDLRALKGRAKAGGRSTKEAAPLPLETPHWSSKAEARLAVFTWIEAWYNPRRRHSALEYLSPLNYERKHATVTHELGLPTAPLASGLLRAGGGTVDNPAAQIMNT